AYAGERSDYVTIGAAPTTLRLPGTAASPTPRPTPVATLRPPTRSSVAPKPAISTASAAKVLTTAQALESAPEEVAMPGPAKPGLKVADLPGLTR
ncbi:MAG TPA: hypothetical protein VFO16_16220, partial [Pseudonocardiaceae bacterium]|nr:hypothetical protein [Pseudonocardiaceae bacterium]